jgi:hypothetical protein
MIEKQPSRRRNLIGVGCTRILETAATLETCLARSMARPHRGLLSVGYLSETQGREAAKLFRKKARANQDHRSPHVLARDGLRSYPPALRELQPKDRSLLALPPAHAACPSVSSS